MKKAKSTKLASAKSGDDGTKAVNEYLASVPEPARATLYEIRSMIRSVVPPGTTEGFSYGIPAFLYHGALVGYAAFEKHCTFFPMSGSLTTAFKNDLKNYQTSKGSIRFPVDKPLPLSLVKKMVKTRVAENAKKKKR